VLGAALCFLAAPRLAWSAGLELHIATGGQDSWSGRLPAPNAERSDGPFASLERARAEVLKIRSDAGLPAGGIRIAVQAGRYPLTRTIEMTAPDSGASNAAVVYRGVEPGAVRIVGGVLVTGFKPVTTPSVLARLDPSARGHVLEADLRAQGVTEFGSAAGNGIELFFNDRPMPIARWPNSGFVKITEVLGKTPVDVRGTKGCVEGLFAFASERAMRWGEEKDIWVHGYWFWDWSDQRQRVKAVDSARGTIEIEPPYHNYGYRKGQWFYAYNLLSEIDRPGEWYADRATGRLYFWPPAAITGAEVTVSMLPTLLALKDVSHVSFEGFTFEAARETAIRVAGGVGVRIAGCTVRNTGGSAIDIAGGRAHAVVACDIYQCGAGGVSLSGGDRRTLEPAGHVADNNDIHHYGRWRPMYSAGIGLYGVGNRATHNRISHAPHQAISFGGNDHRIELNEIHNVCFESNDAGAIYAGRDWTMRGTVIRHNHLHDITGFEGRGCVGVYLDDMFCGTDIIGNLFHRVSSAAFIGGGRDCRIENNVFVDCKPAVHIDARALGWAKYHADEWVKEGREKKTLSGTAYTEPPYRDRYPALPPILDQDPCAPRGNVVARNICVGGRWDDIEGKARPLVRLENNLTADDPRFVNAAAGNFELQADSPALKLGFEPIPLGRIGLYRDALRRTIPAQNAGDGPLPVLK
jgi:hypothetical protein